MKRKIVIFVAITFIAVISKAALAWLEGDQETLTNYQGTFECKPGIIYDPHSIEEVQEVVRQAVDENRKVMTGNRKFASQIDAACTKSGEIQVTLKNMDKVVKFDAENKTITVQAGMRFNKLNDFLREQALAVNMVTELGTFTIGGMLGSGTHGSTLHKKSNMIADYVTELKIVDGLGDVRVLTGESLNAARVNLGVLGIVVEVTIQLEPAFKVKADVKGYKNDNGLEDKVLTIAKDNYSANIAWFPGLGRYTVTTYNPVPLETPGNAYNAQADVSDFQEYMYGLLFNALHEFPGSSLQCLAASVRYNARASSYYRDIDTGKKLKSPVGHSDRMQYFQCKKPDQCIWDRLPIALQEVTIPLEQLPNWIKDVKQIIAKHSRTCFPLNGIYFRFGKASPSYLGMNAGRDSAYISTEYTLRQKGEAVPKNYFVNLEIEQMSLRKYQARPHWGKNSIAIFENMPSRYPKWDEFVAFKQEVDPYNIFTNPFWERVSNQDPLINYLNPGCNASGECYCQTDEHCQSGARCVSGKHFADAKVCM
ncbi:FAD-binding protein [Spartinivicinus sp. A2-2]|uniref:FAD-binding protein n=1 Tax=Spartinivicinus poritis TaxID=2994640 RepID=A0ABT5U559_9GAMM|nr:D-arabinono-1,4-lactone oxidase [Spartinivicinus sp. A2-2]MDE1461497.1 FAD-binding protein [Spartinivicinus sp. A2-2]